MSPLNVAVVIPARYKSSRFPGKPLVKIAGVPMVVRVAAIGAKAFGAACTYVATDDVDIARAVEAAGYQYVMTDHDCATGTDRLVEAAEHIEADIIIDLQGDEPLVNPLDLREIAEYKACYPNHVINAMAAATPEEMASRKVVKVVVDEEDVLLYASRAPVPAGKDGVQPGLKQVCIGAFDRRQLQWYRGAKSRLEQLEDVEVLRFVEGGIPVKMMMATSTHSVDVPEDVPIVEALLAARDSKEP